MAVVTRDFQSNPIPARMKNLPGQPNVVVVWVWVRNPRWAASHRWIHCSLWVVPWPVQASSPGLLCMSMPGAKTNRPRYSSPGLAINRPGLTHQAAVQSDLYSSRDLWCHHLAQKIKPLKHEFSHVNSKASRCLAAFAFSRWCWPPLPHLRDGSCQGEACTDAFQLGAARSWFAQKEDWAVVSWLGVHIGVCAEGAEGQLPRGPPGVPLPCPRGGGAGFVWEWWRQQQTLHLPWLPWWTWWTGVGVRVESCVRNRGFACTCHFQASVSSSVKEGK